MADMLTGSDLVFIVPLWRRTRNIERVADAVLATTPDATVLFVVSMADRVTSEAALAAERMPSIEVIHVMGNGGGQGDYAKKINAGYRWTSEPYLFTGADDVIPHEGWYEAARALMNRDVGVVGTNDMNNRRTMDGEHSTHSLVARWYADKGACMDQDHVIYHAGYWHEFCDDELVRTAMRRGAYAHAFDAVVEHAHWGKDRSRFDETYKVGRAHSAQSRRLFRQRRHLWGDRAPGGMPRQPRVVRRGT